MILSVARLTVCEMRENLLTMYSNVFYISHLKSRKTRMMSCICKSFCSDRKMSAKTPVPQLSLDTASASKPTSSPPRSIAPSFDKASPVFGSSHCKYTRMSSENFRGIDSMDLSVGKTLGSGTYAKVKAAWSHSSKQLVSLTHSQCMLPRDLR